MPTQILRTLPFIRHRDAIERKRARDGIASLKTICDRIGAAWHVSRTTFCGSEKNDTLFVTFDDRRTFHIDIDVPEDYENAADHIAAFVATPEPDPERFDESGDRTWTNAYV